MVIRSAAGQLLDLAGEMRGSQWREDLVPAMAAAAQSGWSFSQVLLFTARLLVRQDATPAELLDAARDPFDRARRPAPDVAVRGAARARDALDDTFRHGCER
jgi:hypothetical protein